MKVLIPYNFTANDEKSIEFAIRNFNGDREVEITLFHAYTPVPEVDVQNNPIMEKLNRTTAYLRQKQEDMRQALDKVKETFAGHGIDPGQIQSMFTPVRQDVAADIIQLVKAMSFDAVVMNRNPGNMINYFSRSISKRVIRRFGRRVQIHIVD